MTDAFGNQLEAGDRIVYGVKHSSSIEMHPAVVTEVLVGCVRVKSWRTPSWRRENEYTAVLHSPNNVIKVSGGVEWPS